MTERLLHVVADPLPVPRGSTNPLVRKLSTVVDLDDDDIAALERLCRSTRDVLPDSDLIRDGDQPNFVTLILDGWACRYKILNNGSRQITAFMLPGDCCDMHVMVLKEMDHSIGALTSVKLAYLSREQLDEVTRDRPNVLRALWWSTLVDEGVLRAWIVNNGRRPALHRIAHLICELRIRAECVGPPGTSDFAMPVTQAEIADALGLTAVHVSRVMVELASRGLVTIRRNRVSIPDIGALEYLAGFDPSYLHASRSIDPVRRSTYL